MLWWVFTMRWTAVDLYVLIDPLVAPLITLITKRQYWGGRVSTRATTRATKTSSRVQLTSESRRSPPKIRVCRGTFLQGNTSRSSPASAPGMGCRPLRSYRGHFSRPPCGRSFACCPARRTRALRFGVRAHTPFMAKRRQA